MGRLLQPCIMPLVLSPSGPAHQPHPPAAAPTPGGQSAGTPGFSFSPAEAYLRPFTPDAWTHMLDTPSSGRASAESMGLLADITPSTSKPGAVQPALRIPDAVVIGPEQDVRHEVCAAVLRSALQVSHHWKLTLF